MLKTEAIQSFLSCATLGHLYSPEMECQVMVSPDEGELVKGEYMGKSWRGYTDGRETWKNFRIPWNAHGEPQYEDKRLTWNLENHVKSIGLTGWNWKRRESTYLGFDIDSVTGHKVGLPDTELNEIEATLHQFDWIEMVRSGGGKGIHIYLHLDEPVKTATHDEHAALAKSLLSVLTVKTGIEFKEKVDCLGSILWVWEERSQSNKGHTYIKKATEKFPTAWIPNNWQQFIGKSKVRRSRLDRNIQELYASHKNILLRPKHKELLSWLDKNAEYTFYWETDWSMLVAHTIDLKSAHAALKLTGLFETTSSGSSDKNCFCFPVYDGSWVIRRFGMGVNEHPIWEKDKKGWTRINYNTLPDFNQVVKYNGGIENSKGSYVFYYQKDIKKALKELGFTYDLKGVPQIPAELSHKDDKIILTYKIGKEDKKFFIDQGFADEGTKMTMVFLANKEPEKKDSLLQDELIRAVITKEEHGGWFANVKSKWILHEPGNIKLILNSTNCHLKTKDIHLQMGEALLAPWAIVSKPFQPEYLGGRQWNKNSPQLSCDPVEGKFPAWEKVLKHCGESLNNEIEHNEECISIGIKDGGDYLLYWLANMVQRPSQSVPYLFFTGEQNCGKSTFHEAASLLFKNKIGYVRANNALTNRSGFNGELLGTVLAVCEEIDLRGTSAYDRVKDMVTGQTILINEKFKTSIEVDNCLHFVQCANDANYFPVFPGDTRTTVLYVSPPSQEIPKMELMERLEKELPYFIYEILNLPLEKPKSRLGIPVIETELKKELVNSNSSELEKFLDERCYYKKGKVISFDSLYQSFKMWLASSGVTDNKIKTWTRNLVGRKFPKVSHYPKGKVGSDNKLCVGNISFMENDGDEKFIYTQSGDRLRRKDD